MPTSPLLDLQLPQSSFSMWPVAPQLRAFVECIWFARSAPDGRLERVLPNGAVEVMINLGPPQRVVNDARYRRFHRAWVAGLHTGPLTITDEAGSDLVGVRFLPGGLRTWLKTPLHTLTNSVEEAEQIEHALPLVQIREQLAELHSTAERHALIEQTLLRTARVMERTDVIHAALRHVRHSGHALSMRSLASQLGISHKHLISRFHDEVGVGPMRLARILRFHRLVLSLREQRRQPHWARVAAEHGFADQSHLVREVRTFSGFAPSAFFAKRTEDGLHVWEAP